VRLVHAALGTNTYPQPHHDLLLFGRLKWSVTGYLLHIFQEHLTIADTEVKILQVRKDLMIIGLQLTNQALIDARHRDVVVERSRT
jgi:hypothetical protein